MSRRGIRKRCSYEIQKGKEIDDKRTDAHLFEIVGSGHGLSLKDFT